MKKSKLSIEGAKHVSFNDKSPLKNYQKVISTLRGGDSIKLTAKTKEQTGVTEEYIDNLQHQIYMLEMELKLMKDREIESKKKLGGIETMFRDGIPLNEHFFALKIKYKKESQEYDSQIKLLCSEIEKVKSDTEDLKMRNQHLQDEYARNLTQAKHYATEFQNRINTLEKQLCLEDFAKDEINSQLQEAKAKLADFKSENMHTTRTMEKNKMFKEHKDQDLEEGYAKTEDQIKISMEKIIKLDLSKDDLNKQIGSSSRLKQLGEDNLNLLRRFNAVDKQVKLLEGKISELDTMKEINLKYLEDETLQRIKVEKEYNNKADDNSAKSKLKEEDFTKKVDEEEKVEVKLLNNNITFQSEEAAHYLEELKNKEELGKQLLEEKMKIFEDLTRTNDNIKTIEGEIEKQKETLRDLVSSIEEFKKANKRIEDRTNKLETRTTLLLKENEKLIEENKKYEISIEELNQKSKLNEALKDVDLDELKALSHNSLNINNTLNKLLGKLSSLA